ncbi:ankyrin repeat-containing domain protein [Hypoxylon trugodes]|uniref:ankyrin repeat-containing domain protein n=1 Tax=Hypoxylon trugodes TaxID=326681 RepID=UPI002194E6DF|nr:ankyrin repeat-containing domain protein [Hypoxylon trugodes]KAI1387666.1 ankyrin repeat-containing domain protein [Hypoxylon trugodes]
MEINIELPGTALERRRLQNRIAQRRFRQKRDQQRHDAALGHGVHTNIETPPTAEVPFIVRSEPVHDVIVEGGAITMPAFSLTGDNGNSSSTSQTEPFSLEDVDFWDIGVVDGFLANGNTAPEFDVTLPSPSEFLRELPAADIAQISPPNSHTNDSQASRPSDSLRRPLRYRRSAQLNEGLKRRLEADDEGWIGSLHIAAQSGHERMVALLLDQGEDPDEKDSDGRTPLTHAIIGGHEAVAKLLLDRGARVSILDQDARSALHWATLCRRETMMRILLERQSSSDEADRIDVDAYDDSGWTPLHMAIHQDFEAGVRMLLQAGATLSSKAQKCPFARKLDSLGLT